MGHCTSTLAGVGCARTAPADYSYPNLSLHLLGNAEISFKVLRHLLSLGGRCCILLLLCVSVSSILDLSRAASYDPRTGFVIIAE